MVAVLPVALGFDTIHRIELADMYMKVHVQLSVPLLYNPMVTIEFDVKPVMV